MRDDRWKEKPIELFADLAAQAIQLYRVLSPGAVV